MPRPDRLTPTFLATAALLALGALPSGRVREALRDDLPSRADYDRLERGYYEQLLDAGSAPGAAAGAGALAGHAEPIAVEHGRQTDKVDDVREYVLKPDMTRDPGRRISWSRQSRE